MLLTVDVGNTNIKLAVFKGDKRLFIDRFNTNVGDYDAEIKAFFQKYGLEEKIDDAIISCVVPNILEMIKLSIKKIIKREPIVVDALSDTGLKINTDNPNEVGSDLVVMCAYAYHLNKKATIILSYGTANVLTYVDADGNFLYCIIGPGLMLQVNSLFKNAAKLPPFKLNKEASVLSNQTIKAMNVGVIDGTIGASKHLINEVVKELGIDDYVVCACGGLGSFVAPYIDEIDYYNPDLVTDGLNYIYLRGKTNE